MTFDLPCVLVALKSCVQGRALSYLIKSAVCVMEDNKALWETVRADPGVYTKTRSMKL